MKSYVTRHEIREINRKMYAIDLRYDGDDKAEAFEMIIAHIIQGSNGQDKIANVPTVVELTEEIFNSKSLDKLQLLDKEDAIIQINNRLIDNQDKASLLKQIKDSGYTVMIEINSDDKYFNYAKMMADIIKIDIKNIPQSIVGQNEFICKKLAYNVDTPDDYVLAESANIDYYEGEYISASVDMDIRQNGHSNINFIDVIKLINEKASLSAISRVISRDPLLSAQVIRLCKSVNNNVSSVAEATENIGIKKLERWIYLLQFGKTNNVPEDLIKESYNRAELCKLLTKEFKIKGLNENQAYMIGLFSDLDILSGRSMNEELVSLNLDKTIEDALIYRDGKGGELLNLVIAYEEANWERIDKYCKILKVNKNRLFKAYFESVTAIARIWDELKTYGGQGIK